MRWFFALCVLNLFAPALDAQELGSLYRDERCGFSFRAPAKWTGIPVSPSEQTIVAQWRGKRGDNSKTGASFMPELNILVFAKAAADNGTPPAKLTDYEGYLKRMFGGGADLLKQEDGTIGSYKVKLYQVNVPLSSGGLARVHTTVFLLDEQDIAVQFTCLEEKYDSYRSDFIASTRSFQAIGVKRTAATESPTPNKVLDAAAEREKFLDEQKLRAKAAGWSFVDSPSKRYLFIFNADKAFVQELTWRLEAIRDHYEKLYPPDKPIEAVSIVRVCKSRDDYIAYGGLDGSGGYWNAKAQELVFFDNKDEDRDTGFAVLLHEGFHQYIYYYYGMLAPHSWYNEGHGDYFAGAELVRKGNSGRVVRIKPLTTRGVNRLAVIKTALQQGATIPLRQFFQYTQRQYYAEDRKDLCYAQGWSIVYFLREGAKTTVMDPRWTAVLPSYLENLLVAFNEAKAAATPPETVDEDAVHRQAFERTFGAFTDEDWARLEKAWKAFQP